MNFVIHQQDLAMSYIVLFSLWGQILKENYVQSIPVPTGPGN